MISTENTRTLTDFRQHATAVIERINHTGEAEILTVNGRARAVILSPAAYDEMARDAQLTRDVAMIRKSMKQFEEGKGRPADAVFDEIRGRLLKMKAGRKKQTAR